MSAKYGHGVDDVKEWILSKLPHGPAYYPKVYIRFNSSIFWFYICTACRIEAFHTLVNDVLMLLHLKVYMHVQDIASEHPERFFIAEIIREKIFMQYRNEVPYASQVSLNLELEENIQDFLAVLLLVSLSMITAFPYCLYRLMWLVIKVDQMRKTSFKLRLLWRRTLRKSFLSERLKLYARYVFLNKHILS